MAIDVNIKDALKGAGFLDGEGKPKPSNITDVFWPREELYREGQAQDSARTSTSTNDEAEATDETE